MINTQVQLVMSMSTTTTDGKPWRHFYNLELTRSSIPTFLFPWTLQHKLDAASPLHSLSAAQWVAARVDVHCVVTAVDSVFGGAIWARHRYGVGEVRFGWAPADVFANLSVAAGADEVGGGGVGEGHLRVIDMALFDAMERVGDEKDDADDERDEHNEPASQATSAYQRR